MLHNKMFCKIKKETLQKHHPNIFLLNGKINNNNTIHPNSKPNNRGSCDVTLQIKILFLFLGFKGVL